MGVAAVWPERKGFTDKCGRAVQLAQLGFAVVTRPIFSLTAEGFDDSRRRCESYAESPPHMRSLAWGGEPA